MTDWSIRDLARPIGCPALLRIRKEFRSLRWELLFSLVSLGMAYVSYMLEQSHRLPSLSFPLAVLSLGAMGLMSCASFGREFDTGMASRLLTEPAGRRHIWWEKTVALLTAYVVIFVADRVMRVVLPAILLTLDALPQPVELGDPGRLSHFSETGWEARIGAVLFFSGAGVLASLLFRRTIGAFLVVLSLPFWLVLARLLLFPSSPDVGARPGIGLLGLWCAATWMLARWRFSRLEDSDWLARAGSTACGLPLRNVAPAIERMSSRAPAHLRKEISIIAPYWITCLFLTLLAPFVFRFHGGKALGFLIIGYHSVLTLLAVSCFGKEFRNGCIQTALAQPLTRAEVWNRKVRAFGTATALLLALQLAGILGARLGGFASFGMSVSIVAATAVTLTAGIFTGVSLRSEVGAFGAAITLCYCAWNVLGLSIDVIDDVMRKQIGRNIGGAEALFALAVFGIPLSSALYFAARRAFMRLEV